MRSFTVKVGKETVHCTGMIADCLQIRYKGKSYLIEPTANGWKARVGKLDADLVKKIGEAVERRVEGSK